MKKTSKQALFSFNAYLEVKLAILYTFGKKVLNMDKELNVEGFGADQSFMGGQLKLYNINASCYGAIKVASKQAT